MTGVTRVRDETGVPAARRPHVPGEPGVWVVVLGDMGVFALLFVVHLVTRIRDPELTAASQQALDPALGTVNTVLLLVSSLLVLTGVRAARAGGEGARCAPRLFVAAGVCGAVFAAVKIAEYASLVGAGITPLTDDFFLYYFMLTGFHLFHLLLGLGLLAVLVVLTHHRAHTPRTPLTPARLRYVEGGAAFWHMVDLLWIVLFPLLYLVR